MFSPKINTQTSQPKNNLFGEKSNGFIQPKLNIGKSGDKYEVEADRAADQIVAKGNENASSFVAPSPVVQKQSDEDVQKQESESEIQQKPVVDKITPGVQLKADPVLQKESEEEIQTKEEEEEVQKKEDDEVQQKAEEESVQAQTDENIQESKDVTQDAKPELTPIQQKSAEEEIQTKEEEEIQEKEEEETVQKQSTSDGSDDSGIENSLSNSKGGGSPLGSETRNEMESGFGADFGGVRVHNDSNAVQMNQELGSQAFTNGNDIYFNEGKYNPESDSGKHLLAHELTHTVQQGASPNSNTVQQKSNIVQKEEAKEPAKPGQPTTVIDLSSGLKLSKDWLEYIEANPKEKKFNVSVKIGSLYQGTIELKKLGKAKEGETQKFELSSKSKRYLDVKGMEFLNPLKEAQVYPILVLNNFGDEQKTSGFLSIRKGQDAATTNVLGVIDSINSNLDKMGFLGIDKINTGGLENKYENGGLNFKANELSVGVDGYIQASGSLGITNSAFTFDVTSTVSVAGLAEGEFNLKRDEKGELAGKANISADIANVNASLTIEYEKGSVTIQGTGKMSSEKFSGEITLLVTDESKSKQMMHAALGVESMEAQAPANPAGPAKKTKNNQVLAGWGTIEATITPWLQGTANVGIDNKGQVTIVGTISVPNEIELMEQRGIKHDLFDVEIRAGYGIPLVGQVFLFASIGMFMNAGFGPLVLKDVAFTGTYSTDPNVLQNFSITGTLGINAFAILGLKAEAGVGVTILGHDVKAGVAVTAAAGIKAYAEATPTFEYKEQKSPQGGKVGESRLKGHFEAAAQLFLQLTGSLFYELDSPWWSPAPDGREDYPLGEVQYPIGDSMGIGADMDWLVGSDQPPELKFAPVEFDPDKFTADVMADPPPKKMGKSDQNPKGKFENKGGGSGQEKDPKATGNGKGLPPNSKKQEDLKNLSDDQKYLRGLDELSKLEKADPKPTIGVVKAKMQKVKSKYGLQSVTIKSEKDGEVTILVKHKKQDNSKNLLKIKMMSEAERKKMLTAAMTDLKKREEKIVDKEGKTEEAKAKDMLTSWAKAHPIIESAKVIDGKTTWDYLLDVGDKNETEKGKPKSGTKEGEGGKITAEEDFIDKAKNKHRLFVSVKGGNMVVFMASTPESLLDKLEKIQITEENKDNVAQAKSEAIALNKYIKDHVNAIAGDDKETESINTYIDGKLKLIKEKVKGLLVEGKKELPLSKVTYSMAGGKPSTVEANPLTKLPGNTKGSKPYQDPVGWKLVEIFKYIKVFVNDQGKHEKFDPTNPVHASKPNYEFISKPDNWIRFHILNEVAMHGPGAKWNLLAAHDTDNNPDYLKVIEDPIKKEMDKEDAVPLYFKAQVTYKGEPTIDTSKFSEKLDVKEIKEFYQELPASVKISVGRYTESSDGTYTEGNGNEVHNNKVFDFRKDIDVNLKPGVRTHVIINQHHRTNKTYGIPQEANKLFTKFRGSATTADQFVSALKAEDKIVKTLETKKDYLKSFIKALNQSSSTTMISFFEGGQASDEMASFGVHVTKLEQEIAQNEQNKKDRVSNIVTTIEAHIKSTTGKKAKSAEIEKITTLDTSNLSRYRKGTRKIGDDLLTRVEAGWQQYRATNGLNEI